MKKENKQRLIDFINAQTERWKDWGWRDCYVGMMQKIMVGDVHSANSILLQDFLGITKSQRQALVYADEMSISELSSLTLEAQKEVLIGALNSITDDNSVVRWDERVQPER